MWLTQSPVPPEWLPDWMSQKEFNEGIKTALNDMGLRGGYSGYPTVVWDKKFSIGIRIHDRVTGQNLAMYPNDAWSIENYKVNAHAIVFGSIASDAVEQSEYWDIENIGNYVYQYFRINHPDVNIAGLSSHLSVEGLEMNQNNVWKIFELIVNDPYYIEFQADNEAWLTYGERAGKLTKAIRETGKNDLSALKNDIELWMASEKLQWLLDFFEFHGFMSFDERLQISGAIDWEKWSYDVVEHEYVNIIWSWKIQLDLIHYHDDYFDTEIADWLIKVSEIEGTNPNSSRWGDFDLDSFYIFMGKKGYFQTGEPQSDGTADNIFVTNAIKIGQVENQVISIKILYSTWFKDMLNIDETIQIVSADFKEKTFIDWVRSVISKLNREIQDLSDKGEEVSDQIDAVNYISTLTLDQLHTDMKLYNKHY